MSYQDIVTCDIWDGCVKCMRNDVAGIDGMCVYCIEEQRDEARRLAELWRDYAMLDFEWCICNAKDESPRFDELLKKWNTGRDWELLPWEVEK